MSHTFKAVTLIENIVIVWQVLVFLSPAGFLGTDLRPVCLVHRCALYLAWVNVGPTLVIAGFKVISLLGSSL
jgi:hypothetical protein